MKLVQLSEHQEQRRVVEWANANCIRFPELGLLYAIPNGGKRSVVTAAKLKAEGVKRGVPDLHLPVARGSYKTLYIEMKKKAFELATLQGRIKKRAGTESDEQKRWRAALSAQGHAVVVCHGHEKAIETLEAYLLQKGS